MTGCFARRRIAVSSLSKETILSGVGAVVLVRGGFVDGSGWEPVYRLLRQHDHRVSVVQNPTLSLQGDVDAAKRVSTRRANPSSSSATPTAEQ